MSKPFLILALPRSRTFWVSNFLSYGQWHCGHDELIHCRSIDDVKSWLAMPNTGSVETLAAPWYRIFERLAPDMTIVTLRRPVDEVMASLLSCGFNDSKELRKKIEYLDHKIECVERRLPHTFAVHSKDLQNPNVAAELYERCLGVRLDENWFEYLNTKNLQIDMTHLCRYVTAHQPQLTKLTSVAKHMSLQAMKANRNSDFEGFSIQEETLDDLIRDGKHLFEGHCAQVGESPDNHTNKNVPMFYKLEDAKALQVITARSNGRMFGYLLAVISDSLEDRTRKSAVHTLFYSDGQIRGLGMKMQRASVETLKSKGIEEVFLHSGVRGSGPRLSTLYKRLGAEEFGDLYRLKLGA